jgi:hypothetical protein
MLKVLIIEIVMSADLWGGKVAKGPSTGIVPHKSLFEKSLPK